MAQAGRTFLPASTIDISQHGSQIISSTLEPTSLFPSTLSGDVSKTSQLDQTKVDQLVLGLPAKRGNSSFTRWLHHIAFTYYRKLFTAIFASNLAAFVVIVVKKHGRPLAPSIASATSANLMVALLFRQENFVNLCYEIAVSCPHKAPLWLRSRLAKVFHYGGAHSGAGVAAVVWYLMYTAVLTRDFVAFPGKWALANLITSSILVSLFCFILAAAHPALRQRYHDHFEAVHRFSGWLALLTFWMHTIFAANQYRALEPIPSTLGRYLIHTPNFWMLCISTSCSIFSWGLLRRHTVYPEVLSTHAIRLHFKYRDMAPFYGLKISTRPLLEWHAFATIPNEREDGKGTGSAPKTKGFSVVVSNAGDWTRECITNPPKRVWVRGAPMHGLLYTSLLFKKIVVVATGSGIGPCLSLFHADKTPRRIFWSTSSPLIIWGENHTRTKGRPDMLAITYKLVVESQAEAVFVISNPKLTRGVVYGMESRGIPAYGAIFDS
ncbi:hypothetical protein FB45DRAFT_993092 [Roridomyces roridus]|uniref:Non-ribosomal peptide synthetase n=1 Tax=Roridomyces roridus TaxID=1738132 RepID=A0AAD7FDD4_9AGAR|nr:hypothetical protein FB45DRAFT_993092 [Roridomyces roridus]